MHKLSIVLKIGENLIQGSLKRLPRNRLRFTLFSKAAAKFGQRHIVRVIASASRFEVNLHRKISCIFVLDIRVLDSDC